MLLSIRYDIFEDGMSSYSSPNFHIAPAQCCCNTAICRTGRTPGRERTRLHIAVNLQQIYNKQHTQTTKQNAQMLEPCQKPEGTWYCCSTTCCKQLVPTLLYTKVQVEGAHMWRNYCGCFLFSLGLLFFALNLAAAATSCCCCCITALGAVHVVAATSCCRCCAST